MVETYPYRYKKSREYIKAQIQDIYDESKQNYGTPKITRKLRQKGELISEHTVGKYMKEIGIRAQWIKPWTITAIDSSVIDTINKVEVRRNTELPLIIHSDRESQYISQVYLEATAKMQRNYSKKAFPWDNACIESFHALIKREWPNRFKIRDYRQAYHLIFEYIEAFYNAKRIHNHCDFMSTNDFEKLYEQTQSNELLLVG